MKDRKPKYPGRVMLTPVEGQSGVYDMERADEPEDVGTPLNKNTFLTDETAVELGLDPADDPTPNDALKKIMGKFDPKVGDVVETVRDDMGDGYVLCNGDVVPDGTYPELREVLPYNTEWRRKDFGLGEYLKVRPLPKAGLWLYVYPYGLFTNGDTSNEEKTKTAVLYDANTGEAITLNSEEITGNTDSNIFGMTYVDDQYVLGVGLHTQSPPKATFYTSTDLENWTLAYTMNCPSSRYPYDLIFDGTSFVMATANISGEWASNIYGVSRRLSSNAQRMSFTGRKPDLLQLPFGYWAIDYPDKDDYTIYIGGSTEYYVGSNWSDTTEYSTQAFFNERYWIMTPHNADSRLNYLYFFDTTTNTYTRKEIEGFLVTGLSNSETAFLHGIEYDKNTNMWAMYLKNTNKTKKYIAYISADSDPTVAASYTVVRVENHPEKIPYGQMGLDKSYVYTVSNTEHYLRDPNQKYLPTHDGDTYKYIYAGGVGE